VTSDNHNDGDNKTPDTSETSSDQTPDTSETSSDQTPEKKTDGANIPTLDVPVVKSNAKAATTAPKNSETLAGSAAPAGNTKSETDSKASSKPTPLSTSSKATSSKATSSKATSSKATSSKATSKPTAKVKSTEKPIPPKRGGKLGAFLALIALAAVAGGGYYGWLYLQDHAAQQTDRDIELTSELKSQRQSLANLQGKLDTVTSLQLKLQQQNNQLGEQAEQVARLKLQVTSQINRLRSLTSSTREDWLLAEAEYLLRLANQRLLTERSTENSLALIQSANNILKDFHEPDLFAVRKQLANDIIALRVAGSVDREGIFLQLTALEALIPDLQLMVSAELSRGEVSVADESLDQIPEEWWSRVISSFKNALSELGNVVRVVDRSEPIEPLLGPQEESLIRQNISFMLEQAQLALLQGNTVIYRSSLEKSRDWIDRYFAMNSQSKVLVAELDKLASISVVQELPDISGSLEVLHNYINQWHLRHDGIDANLQKDVVAPAPVEELTETSTISIGTAKGDEVTKSDSAVKDAETSKPTTSEGTQL